MPCRATYWNMPATVAAAMEWLLFVLNCSISLLHVFKSNFRAKPLVSRVHHSYHSVRLSFCLSCFEHVALAETFDLHMKNFNFCYYYFNVKSLGLLYMYLSCMILTTIPFLWYQNVWVIDLNLWPSFEKLKHWRSQLHCAR